MTRLTVAIPILNRPQNLLDCYKRWEGVDVLFLPDEFGDTATVELLELYGLPHAFAMPCKEFGGAVTYAHKINYAYLITGSEFLLYAADDVYPHDGWLEKALDILDSNLAIGLLGTNDLTNPTVQKGRLATHGIVRRSYVKRYGSASGPGAGPVFYEGYRHACCDAEATKVAISRRAYHYAPEVILEHRHPMKDPNLDDDTYRLGESYLEHDRAVLKSRI
jgi:hypothetical protein